MFPGGGQGGPPGEALVPGRLAVILLAAMLVGTGATVLSPTSQAHDPNDGDPARPAGATVEIHHVGATVNDRRTGAMVEWTGDALYVLGGYVWGQSGSDARPTHILRYDDRTGTFEGIDAALPHPLRNAATASEGEDVYILGGQAYRDGAWQAQDAIYRLDTDQVRLERLEATLPAPIADAQAAWNGQAVYVFGNWTGDAGDDRVIRFSPDSGTVDVTSADAPKTGAHVASVGNGTIWYLGGDLYNFDPANETFQRWGWVGGHPRIAGDGDRLYLFRDNGRVDLVRPGDAPGELAKRTVIRHAAWEQGSTWRRVLPVNAETTVGEWTGDGAMLFTGRRVLELEPDAWRYRAHDRRIDLESFASLGGGLESVDGSLYTFALDGTSRVDVRDGRVEDAGEAITPENSGVGIVAGDEAIYAVGGCRDSPGQCPEDEVWRWDPDTGEREVVGTLAEGTMHPAVAWDGERIWAFGGQTSPGNPRETGELDTIQWFDPETGQSQVAGSLDRPLTWASAAWLDGRAYVLGGMECVEKITKQGIVMDCDVLEGIRAYTPGASGVTKVGTMGQGTIHAIVASHEDRLVILSKDADLGIRWWTPAGSSGWHLNAPDTFAKYPGETPEGVASLNGTVFGHVQDGPESRIFHVDADSPSAVGNFKATPGPGSDEVTLSWDPPAEPGTLDVVAYNVYRNTAAQPPPGVEVRDPDDAWPYYVRPFVSGFRDRYVPGQGVDLLAQVPATTTSYTLAGVPAGLASTYQVAAVSPAGSGALSEPTTAAPASKAPPWAARSLRVNPGPASGQVTLDWGPPAHDGGATVDTVTVQSALEDDATVAELEPGASFEHDTNFSTGPDLFEPYGSTGLENTTVAWNPQRERIDLTWGVDENADRGQEVGLERPLPVSLNTRTAFNVTASFRTVNGAIQGLPLALTGENPAQTTTDVNAVYFQIDGYGHELSWPNVRLTAAYVDHDGQRILHEETEIPRHTEVTLGISYAPETRTLTVRAWSPSKVVLNASTTVRPDSIEAFHLSRIRTGIGPLDDFDDNREAWLDDVRFNITSPTAVVTDAPGEGAPLEARIRLSNAEGPGPWSATEPGRPATPPAAPTNLAATPGPGGGEVTLRWAPPDDTGGLPIEGYRLERSVDGAAFELAGEGIEKVHTIDAGLPNDANVTYRVQAVTAAGPGQRSGTVTARTFALPAPPGNLSASLGPDGDEVTLQWDPPLDTGRANVTGYRVALSNGTVTREPVREIGQRTWALAGDLANDTTYTFHVRTLNPAGASTEAAEVEKRSAGPPGTPGNLTIQPGPDRDEVTLDWIPPTLRDSVPLLGYRVERETGDGFTTVAEVHAPIARWLFDDAAHGFVLGEDVDGASFQQADGHLTFTAYDTPGGERVAGPAFDPIEPNATLTLGARIAIDRTGSDQASWPVYLAPAGQHPGTATGEIGVRYHEAWDGGVLTARIQTADGTTRQALSHDVEPGRAYDVSLVLDGANDAYRARIEAVDGSSASNGAIDLEPGTVANLTLQQVGAVLGAQDDNGRFSGWIDNVTLATTPRYVDGGLASNSTYTYRVRAQSDGGLSTPLDPVEASTPARVPTAPRDVHLTPERGGMRVSWDPPASDGGDALTAYEVHRISRWATNASDETAEANETMTKEVNALSKTLFVPEDVFSSADAARVFVHAATVDCYMGYPLLDFQVNGRTIDEIDPCKRFGTDQPRRHAIDVPVDALQAGENVVRFEDTRENQYRTDNLLAIGVDRDVDRDRSTKSTWWETRDIDGELQIELEIEGPPGATGTAKRIATVQPTRTSYTDTTTLDHHNYVYTVASSNTVGTGDPARTGLRYMDIQLRPTEPTNATVERVGRDGARLTWTPANTSFADPLVGYRVYRGIEDEPLQHVADVPLVYDETRTFSQSAEGFERVEDAPYSEVAWNPDTERIEHTLDHRDTENEILERRLGQPLTPDRDFTVSLDWGIRERGDEQGAYPLLLAASNTSDPRAPEGPLVRIQYEEGPDPMHDALAEERPQYRMAYYGADGKRRVSTSFTGSETGNYRFLVSYDADELTLVLEAQRPDGTTVHAASTAIDPDGASRFRFDRVGTGAWERPDESDEASPAHAWIDNLHVDTRAVAFAIVEDALAEGHTHAYAVTAVNEAGEGTRTPIQTVAIPAQAPSAPADVSAKRGQQEGAVTLSWDAPADPGPEPLEHYEIHRAGPDTELATVATVPATGPRSYTDTGLDPGTTYRYSVVAVSGVGAGPASEEVAISTYRVPRAPTNLSASPEPDVGAVSLEWDAPNPDGGREPALYHVYRRTVGAGELERVGVTSGLEYVDGNASAGASEYSVLAANPAGQGPRSKPALAAGTQANRAGTAPDAGLGGGLSGGDMEPIVDQPRSEIDWNPSTRRVELVADRSDPGDELFGTTLDEPLTGDESWTLSARWQVREEGRLQKTFPLFLSNGTPADVRASSQAVYFVHRNKDPTGDLDTGTAFSEMFLRYNDAAGNRALGDQLTYARNEPVEVQVHYDAIDRTLTVRAVPTKGALEAGTEANVQLTPSQADRLRFDVVGVGVDGMDDQASLELYGWVDEFELTRSPEPVPVPGDETLPDPAAGLLTGPSFETLVEQPRSEIAWDPTVQRIDVFSDRRDPGDEIYGTRLTDALDGSTDWSVQARWQVAEKGNWQRAFPLFVRNGSLADVTETSQTAFFQHRALDRLDTFSQIRLGYRDANGSLAFLETALLWRGEPLNLETAYDASQRRLTMEAVSPAYGRLAHGETVLSPGQARDLSIDLVGVASDGWGSSSEPGLSGWVDRVAIQR